MADNSSIQIKKVKSLTDQKIKVEWTETNSDNCSIMSGTFNELAAPEFYKAFKRLNHQNRYSLSQSCFLDLPCSHILLLHY